jgi:hypothetical protein
MAMKRAVLIGIAALVLTHLTAQQAAAQAGAICLFADPTGTDCTITDESAGTLTIYVVHTLTTGAMGSQFSAPKPSCMAGVTWISDEAMFPVTLGNSQTGVSIGYGTCHSGPVHVLSMTYMTSGTTETHCLYRVRPHPADSFVQMVDCSENLLEADAGRVYLNSDLGCICSESMPPDLAVTPSTLDFGITSTPQTFRIINEGNHTLEWSLSGDRDWLSASPAIGTDEATITVTIDRAFLDPDLNEGHVLVESNGGSETVTVLALNGARLAISPTSLDFGMTDQVEYFGIHNTGICCLSWLVQSSVPWVVAIIPSSGTEDRQVLVAVSRNGLANGVYTGDVSVLSNGGNVTLPITVAVMPTLEVTPSQLSFGQTNTERSITIENTGSGLLEWTASASALWLSVNPAAGMGGGTAVVTVDRSGLPNGDYESAVTVSSNGGDKTLPITMEVLPTLTVSPLHLSYGEMDTERSITIENTGSGLLEWTASTLAPWLSVDPPAGMEDGTAVVTVDRSGLPNGNYEGAVTVSSNGGGESVVLVSMSVQPELVVFPPELYFSASELSRTFEISNAKSGTLEWAAVPDRSWISVTPPSGSGDATVTVQVDPDTAAAGYAEGSIAVTSNGGAIAVGVRVGSAPVLVISPATLQFPGLTTSETFTISNSGGGTLAWTVSCAAPWLQCTPSSGTGYAVIQVDASRCDIPVGPPASASILVTSTGGNGTVAVTAEPMPRLATSPTSLYFSGGPSSTTLRLLTPCTEAISWSIHRECYPTWLVVRPEFGTGPTNVTVSAFVPDPSPSDEVWRCTLIISSPQVDVPLNVLATWDQVQPPPGTGTEQKTWGNVKSKFADPPKK